MLRRHMVYPHRADQPLLEIDAEDIGMAVEVDIVDQGRAGQGQDVGHLIGLEPDARDVFHVLARFDPPVFDVIQKLQQFLGKSVRLTQFRLIRTLR